MIQVNRQTLCSQVFDESDGLVWCEDCLPSPETGQAEARPVLIYLPGVHGDWTPTFTIAPLLTRHFRLIRVAYPRRRWTIRQHGEAVCELLDRLGIAQVHLLAESFGSLVGWEFGLANPGRVRSMVLAGGFTGPPSPISAFLAHGMFTCTPPGLVDFGAKIYLKRLTWRLEADRAEEYRRVAFLATRGRRGHLSLANRMRIVSSTSYRRRLGEVCWPVGYLGGTRDVIVPVRRELRILQRGLQPGCGFTPQIFPRAPHPILPARPRECADWLAEWAAAH